MASAADSEFIDAAVEAVPYTATGLPIVWQCFIGPLHGTTQWADFKPYESLRMEAAWAENAGTVSLTLKEDAWLIDLSLMHQTNIKSGKIRPIRRMVVLKQGVLKE